MSANMLSIECRLSFGEFDLSIDEEIVLGGITGLFGPSGGGKSTVLRIIAGLERSATGSVRFGDECWQDDALRTFEPAHKRPVGYVFQESRLFEHLTVEGNLLYAANRSSDSTIEYADVIATFDLQSLLAQSAGTLSGGQRQRVAIARTLLTQPRLLLLDEPLASLDIERKSDILPYLETLAERYSIPTIYVSHAIDEVARLADRVVVLDDGKVRASGDAIETLNQLELQSPLSRFETVTILDTTVAEQLHDTELTRLDLHGQSIVVPGRGRASIGDAVRLYIRAGDVAVATHRPEGISFRNVLAGTIGAVDDGGDGPFATVVIDIEGTHVRAELTRHAVQDLGLAPGLPVFALLKTASFDSRY